MAENPTLKEKLSNKEELTLPYEERTSESQIKKEATERNREKEEKMRADSAWGTTENQKLLRWTATALGGAGRQLGADLQDDQGRRNNLGSKLGGKMIH